MNATNGIGDLPPAVGLTGATRPQSTVLREEGPVPAAAPAQAWTTGGQTIEVPLTLRFKGSGAEYFRIWIVNLLLTLVTVGIYAPWAKVRKLRYFHANTLVGGHALDFHADPKRMLRGYLLVGALFVLYSVAGRVSPAAGLVALLVVLAVWPALLYASLRFRLFNTSWRGLRFGFDGTLGDAYRSLLPLLAPALVVFGAPLVMPDALEADASLAAHEQVAFFFAYGATFLAMVLLIPLVWFRLGRYHHGGYRYAGLRSRFDARAGAFYRTTLKIAGVVLAGWLALVGLMALLFIAAGPNGGDGSATSRFWDGPVLGLLFGALFLLVVQPYIASRAQNLVWSNTSAPGIRFLSALRYLPLAALTAKNWLLVVVTLGLYWPFAAVATTRLRIEAVSIATNIDLDSLLGTRVQGTTEAGGAAAGDLFGIDIAM